MFNRGKEHGDKVVRPLVVREAALTQFLRAAYNYDPDAVSSETATVNDEPSMTKQSFAEECDINTIVRRFLKTGELPQERLVKQYGDFTGVNSFHDAMNIVLAAEDAFYSLNAELRERFGNNPANLAEFMDNLDKKENFDEALKLGLIEVPEPLSDRAPSSAPKGAQKASKPSDDDDKGGKGE